jgi:hypothetical protein
VKARDQSEEQPNALTVDEVLRFMANAHDLFPQHYAMLALELATVRRPSEMRPLQRAGTEPDLLWFDQDWTQTPHPTSGRAGGDTARSRRGPAYRTDAGIRAPIPLPDRRLPRELLPRQTHPCDRQGGQDREAPDRPLMRRTFQDLCRTAAVHDFVTRAISRHATSAMQERYISVDGEEVRAGLAKVISLAGPKR